MSKQEFILKIFHEGREWAKLIVPALVAWHMPAPGYMKKKDEGAKSP